MYEIYLLRSLDFIFEPIDLFTGNEEVCAPCAPIQASLSMPICIVDKLE